jgi:hypothetical protein
MTTMTKSNRTSSNYGSLLPGAALNISNNSHDDDDDDERAKLMGHCHSHHRNDQKTTTTSSMTLRGNSSSNKRLIVFLSILTALSVVTSSTLLVLHLGGGGGGAGDLGDDNDDGSGSSSLVQPWGWFRLRSAQQVADEALETLNQKRQLLEEERNFRSFSSSTSSSITNPLAAVQVLAKNDSPPPDNTLPLLNFHKQDSKSKLKEGCEASVVIVRHCEKGNIREHCAYTGYERSVYLATLFGDDHETRWPTPSYIFALAPGGRNNKSKMNFREIETAGPLAEKSGVKVNYAYDQEDNRPLAKHIHELLHSGELCGKVAFVAWKHSRIGHLAHLLGCGPKQHCPIDFKGTTFDPAWTIQFSYRRLLHSANKGLKIPKHPAWHVSGSVQYENFDPLAFSKRSGDYPRGGRSTGAHWEDRAEMIPERKKSTASSLWMRKPDFLGIGPADVDVKGEDDDDTNNDIGWRT